MGVSRARIPSSSPNESAWWRSLPRRSRTLVFSRHSAESRAISSSERRCEIAPDRHHANVEWYGNTGAASSGTVLSQNWDKWEGDDDVAVVGVGSGLTWAAYLARFGEGESEQ